MYYGVLFPPPASTYLLLGEVSGEALWPCHLSVAGAATVTVNERHCEYPAQGLTGNRRQQRNLANGLQNYTYEVIWSFATAFLHLNDGVKKFLWILATLLDPRFKKLKLDFFKGCEDLE